ncbi:MAG: hypothetical protein LBL07_00620 [Tannerella sp.]|jgi:hypothetical protein|nr:hypothetical protein [Tannerella sp.]
MTQAILGKFKLEFASPKLLNELQQGQYADKVVWNYHNTLDLELILDADDWHIECPANGKTGKLADWVVNEDTCQFALKDEEGIDNYTELEYPFAVAMLGQLVERTDLIRYLISLQEVLSMTPGKPMEKMPLHDKLETKE